MKNSVNKCQKPLARLRQCDLDIFLTAAVSVAERSGVTGGTAPSDTHKGVTPELNKKCG